MTKERIQHRKAPLPEITPDSGLSEVENQILEVANTKLGRSSKEFQLFSLFWSNRNQVFHMGEIENFLWAEATRPIGIYNRVKTLVSQMNHVFRKYLGIEFNIVTGDPADGFQLNTYVDLSETQPVQSKKYEPYEVDAKAGQLEKQIGLVARSIFARTSDFASQFFLILWRNKNSEVSFHTIDLCLWGEELSGHKIGQRAELIRTMNKKLHNQLGLFVDFIVESSKSGYTLITDLTKLSDLYFFGLSSQYPFSEKTPPKSKLDALKNRVSLFTYICHAYLETGAMNTCLLLAELFKQENQAISFQTLVAAVLEKNNTLLKNIRPELQVQYVCKYLRNLQNAIAHANLDPDIPYRIELKVSDELDCKLTLEAKEI